MSLSKEQREWLSQQIVSDTKENLYDSEEFIFDCVYQVVSKLDDRALLEQYGIDPDDSEAIEETLEGI